jgi:VIT1/CCC1 family predicted Fe2+/Mn2+ transporter
MSRLGRHREHHLVSRIGWLRAAVLGANDGIVSTASLIVGVAAAPGAQRAAVLLAGVAGLVAGAMSMAAGEYVSVSSQADTEAADLKRETGELTAHPAAEHAELAAIYQARGLEPTLAQEVARQLMTHDALQAHARDELGITEVHAARPIQAALTSAATFGGGAAAPLVLAAVTPGGFTVAAVAFGSLLFLAVLGVIGAEAGGAGVWKVAARVTFWGAVAMAVTAGIGRLVGTAV